MKLVRLFFLSAVSLAFFSTPDIAAANATTPGTCSVQRPCICMPVVGDPVCGMDGKEYSSDCLAGCECVDVAYPGPCKDDCTKDCFGEPYAPVCGDDGVTYGNACLAKCMGAEVECGNACGAVCKKP